MLEIIFLIIALYLLIVGKIALANRIAQRGIVRAAGVILLLVLAFDGYVWSMAPIGLSPTDARNLTVEIMLFGFAGASALIFRAFWRSAPANAASDMVTLSEAANYYLVSVQDVEQMIRAGAIKAQRVDGQRKVSRDAVGNYLKRSGTANNFLPDLPDSIDDA